MYRYISWVSLLVEHQISEQELRPHRINQGMPVSRHCKNPAGQTSNYRYTISQDLVDPIDFKVQSSN